MDTLIQTAFQEALETFNKAYAQYSHFKVGVVIKPHGSSKLYRGCNVENAVNGASTCAERGAVANMIAHEGPQATIEWAVIVADSEDFTPPCGVCRQVLYEFCENKKDIALYLFKPNGEHHQMSLLEIFPHAFNGKSFL